jgi:hypothetical protein
MTARLVAATALLALSAGPRAGVLRPAPDSASFWPTRVCVSGPRLVIENDCGCNDAILCRVVGARAPALRLDVRRDPSRPQRCDDCFPMVPGRCDLPPLSPGRWTVELGGAAAFDLDVGEGGALPDGACWEQDRSRR